MIRYAEMKLMELIDHVKGKEIGVYIVPRATYGLKLATELLDLTYLSSSESEGLIDPNLADKTRAMMIKDLFKILEEFELKRWYRS